RDRAFPFASARVPLGTAPRPRPGPPRARASLPAAWPRRARRRSDDQRRPSKSVPASRWSVGSGAEIAAGALDAAGASGVRALRSADGRRGGGGGALADAVTIAVSARGAATTLGDGTGDAASTTLVAPRVSRVDVAFAPTTSATRPAAIAPAITIVDLRR